VATDTEQQSSDEVLDSDNLRDIRNYARNQEKRAKAAEKQAKELEGRLQAVEAKEAQGTARDLVKAKGLNDAQADMLLKLNPTPDAEAIDGFVAAFGIQPTAPAEGDGTGEVLEAPAAPAAGTPPQPGHIAPGTPAPAKAWTSADYKEALLKGDMSTLERIAADAVRNPASLKLEYAHLIEDD